MSFWNKAFQVAKDLGTTAVNTLNEQANNIRETRLKLEDYEDHKLIQIANGGDGFFGPSSTERGIALSILKSRGYTVEEINAHKR
ncbi:MULTISPECIES: hypothetical protein [Bacteria]|uniref:hypothetical protein n=1 Tax=Bacteria TaxID=2 RepID=UPI000D1BCEC7|nr:MULTISPECIES: hypothetical protein [Bacteria]